MRSTSLNKKRKSPSQKYAFLEDIILCTGIRIFLQVRTASVDLATDTSLVVDISDALSEQEKVKFTVHTKVRQSAW